MIDYKKKYLKYKKKYLEAKKLISGGGGGGKRRGGGPYNNNVNPACIGKTCMAGQMTNAGMALAGFPSGATAFGVCTSMACVAEWEARKKEQQLQQQKQLQKEEAKKLIPPGQRELYYKHPIHEYSGKRSDARDYLRKAEKFEKDTGYSLANDPLKMNQDANPGLRRRPTWMFNLGY